MCDEGTDDDGEYDYDESRGNLLRCQGCWFDIAHETINDEETNMTIVHVGKGMDCFRQTMNKMKIKSICCCWGKHEEDVEVETIDVICLIWTKEELWLYDEGDSWEGKHN